MTWRLTVVQNRPTQFDMPLYALMQASKEWSLQVFYTHADTDGTNDHELNHAHQWDHVPLQSDRGIYLSKHQRQDISGLADRIAKHLPDLVVVCGYYPRMHARLVGALKRRRLRVGLRSDNTLLHGDFRGWKGAAKRLLLPPWLARYDCWHPVGTLAQRYLETVSLRHRPSFPFPYTVDVDWFERQSSEARLRRTQLRSELGLAADDFVVLGVMKWHQREDPVTLVRGFARFNRCHQQSRLVLVGDGPLRNEIEGLSTEIGGSVILPGYQPYSRLPMLYAVSDVFVHPCVNEPWGVSVHEALCCSLPVLVAEGVGSRFDLLEDGVTGNTFPNGAPDLLAEQLSQLASDPQLLANMQSASKERAHRLDYRKTMESFSAACHAVTHAA